MENILSRSFINKQVKQYYLHAIEGKTYKSEDNNVTQMISELKFHFIVISNPEDKKSWRNDRPLDYSSGEHQSGTSTPDEYYISSPYSSGDD